MSSENIINNNYEDGIRVEEQRRKRGRRKKNEMQDTVNVKDQNRFTLDVNNDVANKELITNLLNQANKKSFGKKILFKDIAIAGIQKLNSKDIEKLQEMSLSDIEKIKMAHLEFNKKSNSNLTFNEFLIKRLGIN